MSNTLENTFRPVSVGFSPAGVHWIAYRPENVEPMRARLALIWDRHKVREYDRKAEQDSAGDEFSGRMVGAEIVRHAYRAREEVQAAGERARELVRFGRLADALFSDHETDDDNGAES